MLQRATFIGRDLIWLLIVFATLLEKNASMVQTGFWREAGVFVGTAGFVGACITGALMLLAMGLAGNLCGRHGKACLRSFRTVSCASLVFCQGDNFACMQRWINWRSRRRVRFMVLIVTGLFIPWTVASLFLNYPHPGQICAIVLTTCGYLTAFVTNTIFYLGFRPQLMYTVYWMHDWILGHAILAPFRVLSSVTAMSGAHMRLLCKPHTPHAPSIHPS
jgi:hypothetical protein